MEINNLFYWVWLSSLVRISPRKRFELLNYYKEPALIWHSTERELKSLPFLTPQALSQLTDRQLRKDANRHFEDLYTEGIDIVHFNDNKYPEYLKDIYDPPVVLYVKGKLDSGEKCLAVVGSRRATAYGLCMAERISAELAKSGITVVSGMARGIDSKAHNGALSVNGRTIAVLGCGLDIVYPYENRELMKNIANSGAVISEFLPGVPPIPYNFPARNRIISGISLGVAIIEANEKSGSLITANYALEQGRDVFAVPGNINSMNSAGTNRLIRDGAIIVTAVSDILDELNIGYEAKNPFYLKKSFPKSEFTNDEILVAKKLTDGPVHIDLLARDSGLSVQMVGSILVMLELKGFVEQLPGKFYKLSELT